MGIYRYNGTEVLSQEDTIATEAPLTIKIDGEEFATLVYTPTDTIDLVTGFLASEGLIRFVDQIESLTLEEERGFVHVKLRHLHQLSQKMVSKRFIGSCCGKSRQFYFHNDARTAKTVSTKLQLSIQQCFHLINQLQEQSADFRPREVCIMQPFARQTNCFLAGRTSAGITRSIKFMDTY